MLLMLATICFLASCAEKTASSQQVVPADKSKSLQRNAELERMAHMGVAIVDADAALSGDPSTALKIAISFAQGNKPQEARYWYQIAAENGDPIGMQHLSVFLRKSDCRRANFWLKKYLSFGDDVVTKEDRDLFNASLLTYEAECSRANGQPEIKKG
jgi:TPR repeat protein